MFSIVLQVLLVILLVLQIIMLIHMLYTSHKTYKQDKAFWDHMIEKENQFYNDLKVTVNCIAEAEEEAKSEQGEEDKSL